MSIKYTTENVVIKFYNKLNYMWGVKLLSHSVKWRESICEWRNVGTAGIWIHFFSLLKGGVFPSNKFIKAVVFMCLYTIK